MLLMKSLESIESWGKDLTKPGRLLSYKFLSTMFSPEFPSITAINSQPRVFINAIKLSADLETAVCMVPFLSVYSLTETVPWKAPKSILSPSIKPLKSVTTSRPAEKTKVSAEHLLGQGS